MPELTPAAKAVKDEVWAVIAFNNGNDQILQCVDVIAAAAIRAAADQVLPYTDPEARNLAQRIRWRARQHARVELLDIAYDLDPVDHEVDDA